MIKSYINLIFGEVSADGVKFHLWVCRGSTGAVRDTCSEHGSYLHENTRYLCIRPRCQNAGVKVPLPSWSPTVPVLYRRRQWCSSGEAADPRYFVILTTFSRI